MEQKLDIIKCFDEAWQFFKARPGLAIGGGLLYLAISIVGQLIPLINIVFGIFVAPAILAGYYLISLNLAGVRAPSIENLFDGFSVYGKVMGVYWLYALAALTMMIPSFIVLIVSAIQGSLEDDPALFMVVVGLNGIAIAILLLRWSMIFFIMIDEPTLSVTEVFSRSSQLTKGNRLALVGFFLLLVAVTILGVLALVIGYFVAYPICMIAWARAYLWLKSFHPPVGAIADQQPAQ